MLAIKLQRVGKKHQPSYRLVVAEKRSKMAGPPVEDLGSYSPFTKAATFNKDRVLHWVKMGAQPTLTVHNLLAEKGILAVPKIVVKMKKKKAVEGSAEAPKAAAVAEMAAPTEEAKTVAEPAATPADEPKNPEPPLTPEPAAA
jgi:small subunit ribosomal protein S16